MLLKVTRGKMIEEQWPAARALVGWSQGDLAAKLGASVLTIKRLESGSRNVSDVMRQRAKEALESAGVIFVEENGEGPGVRLRKVK
jgi:ribosome-binding protein aMBF1 (putative translation factor)